MFSSMGWIVIVTVAIICTIIAVTLLEIGFKMHRCGRSGNIHTFTMRRDSWVFFALAVIFGSVAVALVRELIQLAFF